MSKVIFKVAALCCALFFVVYFLTGGEGLSFSSAADDEAEEAQDEESSDVEQGESDDVSDPESVDATNLAPDAGHLRFKGVPIDGSLSVFVRNMKAKGFVVESSANGCAILTGDFAGFKDCEVAVSTLTGQDLVAGITVRFADREKWGEILSDYTALKDLLTQKYGKPASCVEEFENRLPFSKLDDSAKLLKLKMDKCNFTTVFKPANGTVALHMDHVSYSECFVTLSYADRNNSASVRQRALDDL